VDDAFVQDVAALPASDQVRVVAEKLKRRNPGFDGRLTPTVRDDKVTGLSFSPLQVFDLSPVRALADLESLDCGSPVPQQYGKITDLAPLRGLRLNRMRVAWNRIEDLSPPHGSPLSEARSRLSGRSPNGT
jgi:hypothetical protein